MFNIKAATAILGVTLAVLFVTAPSLEAGHCRGNHCSRTQVSLNVSPTYVAQRPATYYVESPSYVVERSYYEPIYRAPVQEVVVYQAPVYRPVYVAPQPALFTGFSLNWFFR